MNELSLHGRGVFACISPWNFPLAIFAGQVTAALAAGNSVVAKPAEPTPLIAARFVKLLHEAGVPPEVLQLTPSPGAHIRRCGVRARGARGRGDDGFDRDGAHHQPPLAARDGAIVPLIAETGGMNAMLVDSTALPEQVVDDVVTSAFMSAGQRCSALRLLFLQEEIADTVIEMIAGAMDELVIGDPGESRDRRRARSSPRRRTTGLNGTSSACAARPASSRPAGSMSRMRHGSFVAPHLIELDDAAQLTREEFGPLLHVVRYRSQRHRQGARRRSAPRNYGLTLGVQTRLESFWRAGVRGHVHRQHLREPQHDRRSRRRAAVRRQRTFGHGPEGRRPALRRALRERADADRQYHGDRRQRGAAESRELASARAATGHAAPPACPALTGVCATFAALAFAFAAS